MKVFLYPRLAWQGVRKNAQMYVPYLLTCSLMVMVFYIMAFLKSGDTLKLIGKSAGSVTAMVLGMGLVVVGLFAIIFLYYTHSFIIRRRMREFGLYNVLGMGKGNLARVMICETLLVAVISLMVGLALGMLLARLAELLLVQMLNAEIITPIYISIPSILLTVGLFAAIYALILVSSLVRMRLSRPVELLRSEAAGEKPPKANWLLALAGLVMLLVAYWLAVSSNNVLIALQRFFFAVLMVIVATYMLFISGSVALCRILQKRKGYYYQPSHFISLSSMAFRMKRNGAGLASICILCTMVLVMISSTFCLYTSMTDIIYGQYPHSINQKLGLELELLGAGSDERVDAAREAIYQAAEKHGVVPKNMEEYTFLAGYGKVVNNDFLLINGSDSQNIFPWELYIFKLEDYNRVANAACTLDEGEALIFTQNGTLALDMMNLYGVRNYRLKPVESMPREIKGTNMGSIFATMYMIVPDYDDLLAALCDVPTEDVDLVQWWWTFGYDVELDLEEEHELAMTTSNYVSKSQRQFSSRWSYSTASRQYQRLDFIQSFGGLFFLAVVLGLVFTVAAVLIIYYKQLCEGYEDASRFEIMRKVGLQREDIRKSVNSQVLTVFFAPLLLSGLHLLFAFPLISLILRGFGFSNQPLLVTVSLVSYVAFGLLYVIIYRLTSRSYYAIVSGAKGAVM